MSLGWAAWPEPDTTYFGLGWPAGSSDAASMPSDDGGMFDGIVL